MLTSASSTVVAPAVATTMSSGSSSQVPARPALAPASTMPLRTPRLCLPEVSTWPPAPPAGPPRALMRPSNWVTPSAHSTTRPPSPAWVALASMRAPSAMTVVSALRSVPWPCQPPPTSTVPPPAGPLASIRAPGSSTTCWPSTLTLPPWALGEVPATSIVPDTRVTPAPPPSITTCPPRSASPLARTMPCRLSTVSAMLARAAARNSAPPPWACKLPNSARRAARPSARGLKKMRPSPSTSTSTAPTAARPTRPASTLPPTDTRGPTRATVPCGARISPSARNSPGSAASPSRRASR